MFSGENLPGALSPAMMIDLLSWCSPTQPPKQSSCLRCMDFSCENLPGALSPACFNFSFDPVQYFVTTNCIGPGERTIRKQFTESTEYPQKPHRIHRVPSGFCGAFFGFCGAFWDSLTVSNRSSGLSTCRCATNVAKNQKTQKIQSKNHKWTKHTTQNKMQ